MIFSLYNTQKCTHLKFIKKIKQTLLKYELQQNSKIISSRVLVMWYITVNEYSKTEHFLDFVEHENLICVQ